MSYTVKKNIVIIIEKVISIEDTLRILENLILTDWAVSRAKLPCGPDSSVHPWSKVLIILELMNVDGRATICVVKCVRNHIVIKVFGKFKNLVDGVNDEVRILGCIQKSPKKVKIRAASFKM